MTLWLLSHVMLFAASLATGWDVYYLEFTYCHLNFTYQFVVTNFKASLMAEVILNMYMLLVHFYFWIWEFCLCQRFSIYSNYVHSTLKDRCSLENGSITICGWQHCQGVFPVSRGAYFDPSLLCYCYFFPFYQQPKLSYSFISGLVYYIWYRLQLLTFTTFSTCQLSQWI